MSSMHSLTIVFGPAGGLWTFLFKSRDAACFARDLIGRSLDGPMSSVGVTDDYGNEAFILARDIHGFLLEDMNLSGEGSIERGLHQARVQATANRKAQSDPVIKTAQMVTGQPMQPFGRN